MDRCLICGRRLSWLQRWLGIQICWRRECRRELDEAEPGDKLRNSRVKAARKTGDVLVDAYLSLTRPFPSRSDLDVTDETLRWFECPDTGTVSLEDCCKALSLDVGVAQRATFQVYRRTHRI